MLSGGLSHAVIAAHEAGHVVTALHLGLTPLGVRLIPIEGSPAATSFPDGVLAGVSRAQRERLAFAGMAGQLYQGTGLAGVHVAIDMAWLKLDYDPDNDWPSGGGIELLAEHADRFEVVNSRLLQGLSEGREFMPLDELLAT